VERRKIMYVVNLIMTFDSKSEADDYIKSLFEKGDIPQKFSCSGSWDGSTKVFREPKTPPAKKPFKSHQQSVKYHFLKLLPDDETPYDDARAIWLHEINDREKAFENAVYTMRKAGYLLREEGVNGYVVAKSPLIKTEKAINEFGR
jgi:hypothetical protein